MRFSMISPDKMRRKGVRPRNSGIWISARSIGFWRGDVTRVSLNQVIFRLVEPREADETAQTESDGLVDTVHTTRRDPVRYEETAASRPWKLWLEKNTSRGDDLHESLMMMMIRSKKATPHSFIHSSIHPFPFFCSLRCNWSLIHVAPCLTCN